METGLNVCPFGIGKIKNSFFVKVWIWKIYIEINLEFTLNWRSFSAVNETKMLELATGASVLIEFINDWSIKIFLIFFVNF
jgi:hypothetical protein